MIDGAQGVSQGHTSNEVLFCRLILHHVGRCIVNEARAAGKKRMILELQQTITTQKNSIISMLLQKLLQEAINCVCLNFWGPNLRYLWPDFQKCWLLTAATQVTRSWDCSTFLSSVENQEVMNSNEYFALAHSVTQLFFSHSPSVKWEYSSPTSQPDTLATVLTTYKSTLKNQAWRAAIMQAPKG